MLQRMRIYVQSWYLCLEEVRFLADHFIYPPPPAPTRKPINCTADKHL